MGEIDQKRGVHGRGQIILALLCVLLVALAGTLQAVHIHPSGDVYHADCSLCAAAHVTVQVVQSPAPAPPIAVVAAVELFPSLAAPAALSTFALFTRPPPVDIFPA
jgi:hypothetical protein